jgi:peptidoglycan/xylan/chitin deacetylase (PgdA/CDA1 family)
MPLLKHLKVPATVFVVANAAERCEGFWWDQPRVVDAATAASRNRWLHQLHGDGAAILHDMSVAEQRVPDSHRAAGWDLVRRHVGDGIDLGVHSATHRALPTLCDGDLAHEVTASRAAVHRATGVWADFFAYPYGLCDGRVRAHVRAAGYRAALALGAGLNTGDADQWCLRRINVPADISDSAFDGWTAGFNPRRQH